MPYTYTGLKEWTGNTCNGVMLDDPQDFWNEHQFYYECTLSGRYYAFKPDLIGYADGRVSVQIIHPDFAEVIDLEFSPINEIWVEYIPGRGRDTHYICTGSVIPCILEPLLYAAVKRCRNFRPEYADFMPPSVCAGWISTLMGTSGPAGSLRLSGWNSRSRRKTESAS